jgi:hypothetical protein
MQSAALTHYRAFGLASLLGISEQERNDYSPCGVAAIHNLLCSRLKTLKALRDKKHWAYCPAKHLALQDAFKLERIAYDRLHPITLLRAEAANSRNAQQAAFIPAGA